MISGNILLEVLLDLFLKHGLITPIIALHLSRTHNSQRKHLNVGLLALPDPRCHLLELFPVVVHVLEQPVVLVLLVSLGRFCLLACCSDFCIRHFIILFCLRPMV